MASLFGTGVATTVLLPDDVIGPSTYLEPTVVGSVERDRIEQAAVDIASQVLPQFATLAPCAPGTDPRTCAQTFVTSFGRRAFRRPLLQAEIDKLLALYDTLHAAPISYVYQDAIQTLLSAILQSPQFIYHWELGPSAPISERQFLRLNKYELASRLSYFIWGSMPDDALLAAADAGDLDSAEGVANQATRMLALPAASQLFTDMVGQWLQIERLPSLVKDAAVATVDDTLRTAMNDEFRAFIGDTLFKRGSYVDLLTSTNGFVSAPLAPLYGLTGAFGPDPTPTPLPNGRAGVFSQTAFLSIQALPQEDSPVRRGKLIANRLLCRVISPPPPALNPVPPPVPPGSTTRQAYASHSTNQPCATCHTQMDPLGFAFEHFDAIGRYRDSQSGQPIDATGTIHHLDGVEVPFDGAQQMLKAIAGSTEGQSCFVQQLTRYALARDLGDFDGATTDHALIGFKSASLDARALVPLIANSMSFRYRMPSAGEVTQ